MKKMLVTGGAGFIGSNFVRYVLAQYPAVEVVNLDALTYAGNLENLTDVQDDPRYTFVKGDIRDRQLAAELFARYDFDTVVNFAAESHVDRSITEPELFLTTNIIGTQTLLDAAHAFGVSENGVNAAVMGDVSMFSFHATKVFHTVEGGCLAYNDGALEPFFTAWEKFGMYDGEQAELMGTNAKMTEFSAAMGLCNLRHLDEQIDCRRQAAERYRRRLNGLCGIVLSPEQTGVVSNYAYMPVRVLPEELGYDRNAVMDALAGQEIFARKYFYPLTSAFPLVQQNYPVQATPLAQKVSEEILCLPLYADLTAEQVDRICDVITGL